VSTLLSVELRRFLARRLVRVATVIVLLGIVVAGIATAAKSHRTDIAGLESAARAEHDRIVAECISGQIGPPSDALPPGQSREQFCQSLITSEIRDPRFHLSRLVDVFKGTTVPMVLLAWVLSASFIGAEWHAGTVTTLLTWEPRRVRVLLSKALVCMAIAFVATLLFHALLLGALTPAAALRGTTEGVNGAWFRELAGVVLRGGALAAMGAGIGFSIAAVARGTSAALGVGFGYLLIVEQLLGGVRQGWRSWFFTWNAAVFVHGHRLPEAIPRSPTEAALLLSLYATGAVALALLAFQTRDVT
jgi:hypothetical protein